MPEKCIHDRDQPGRGYEVYLLYLHAFKFICDIHYVKDNVYIRGDVKIPQVKKVSTKFSQASGFFSFQVWSGWGNNHIFIATHDTNTVQEKPTLVEMRGLQLDKT